MTQAEKIKSYIREIERASAWFGALNYHTSGNVATPDADLLKDAAIYLEKIPHLTEDKPVTATRSPPRRTEKSMKDKCLDIINQNDILTTEQVRRILKKNNLLNGCAPHSINAALSHLTLNNQIRRIKPSLYGRLTDTFEHHAN